MTSSPRPDGRAPDQLRAVRIERHYTKHAEGSVLVSFGDTRVLCTASIDNKAPGFLRGKGEGWVTAEYSMLPRATHTRGNREAAKISFPYRRGAPLGFPGPLGRKAGFPPGRAATGLP